MLTAEQIDELRTELARLSRIEEEYRVTMHVLALVTERLLAVTDADALTLDLPRCVPPDLSAWREPDGVVHLKVSR